MSPDSPMLHRAPTTAFSSDGKKSVEIKWSFAKDLQHKSFQCLRALPSQVKKATFIGVHLPSALQPTLAIFMQSLNHYCELVGHVRGRCTASPLRPQSKEELTEVIGVNYRIRRASDTMHGF